MKRNGAPRSLHALRFALLLLMSLPGAGLAAALPQPSDSDVASRLKDFDAWMNKTLKDWNVPGIGVGVVVGDKLVFAKGYGYRDYGQKLPFTPSTLYQIASNSKLYTTWLLEGYESDGDCVVVDREALQRMVMIRRELYRRFCRRAVLELPADHPMANFCKFVNDSFDKEDKEMSSQSTASNSDT